MHVEHALRAGEHGHSGYLPYSKTVLNDADIVCATRTAACVMFTGGRSARLLAERIHRESGWRYGPFQAVDCEAPDAVLERVLFAPLEADLRPVKSDTPLLRLLQPGTMFLQDVGRLSLPAQERLRDLLEIAAAEGRGRRSRRRIMAWAPEPLLPNVTAGTFDDTLFYRLNALHFVLTD
ncbi:MAG TPA: sigma 54-interacting transcriptional regulator [Vicinamibacterales bacterium]|nr:sigma 54-interacting transcriptional regulator [Vicinamibacterales bacterium]